MEKQLVVSAQNMAGGYKSQIEGCAPNEMSVPSANVRLTLLGQAKTRPGYLDTGWNLGYAGNVPFPARMERYGLTFFAVSTKILYRKDSDGAIYDTGATITAGADHWMEDYVGNMHFTNPVDGQKRIGVGTLSNAVASADTIIPLSPGDVSRFASSGNVRINGVDIAYSSTSSLLPIKSVVFTNTTALGVGSVTFTFNSVTSIPADGKIAITFPAGFTFSSGGTTAATSTTIDNSFSIGVSGQTVTATRGGGGTIAQNGTQTLTLTFIKNPSVMSNNFFYSLTTSAVTPFPATLDSLSYPADALVLTSTAGAAYASGEPAIYVDNTLTANPAGSKLTFWRESMNVIGVRSKQVGYDSPAWSLFYSKFADPSHVDGMKRVYDFTTNQDGSGGGASPTGQYGELTNEIAIVNRIFAFKTDSCYLCNASDVNTTTGVRPFQLFSNKYGCANKFSAEEMNGQVVWLTNNKRIMQSIVTVPNGSMYPTVLPDETFDRPIYELLQTIDDDQSGAGRMHYWTKGRLLFVIVAIKGQKYTLIYDNNVQRWLPPDTNKNFNAFFEINGDLYACSDNNQNIYQVEVGSADAGAPIDSVVATGNLQITGAAEGKGFATCDWEETEWRGGIAVGTIMDFTPYINGYPSNTKTINAQDVITSSDLSSIGTIAIGDAVVGGGTDSLPGLSDFSYRVLNYPSIGQKCQLVWETSGDGAAFSIYAYKIYVTEFSDSFLTSN